MHNNYHFLKHLIAAVSPHLIGLTLVECFSQQRDELVMGFAGPNEELWLRAQLGNGPEGTGAYVTFLRHYARAKRNTANLFPELVGKRVTQVDMTPFDRSFSIRFDPGHQEEVAIDSLVLCLMLHGPKSNAILLESSADAVKTTWTSRYGFHQKRKADLIRNPDVLARNPDLSYDCWLQHKDNLTQWLPTLGPIPIAYLHEQGYAEANEAAQWLIVQSMLATLEQPEQFYHTLQDGKPLLSLLTVGEVRAQFTDPIEALNTYIFQFLKEQALVRAKQELTQQLVQRIRQTEKYIVKTEERLNTLESERNPEELGHLLLANVHLVQTGDHAVTVADWYQHNADGTPLQTTIKLKPDVSVTTQAEAYYRKAGNRKLEIDHLKHQLVTKRSLLSQLTQWQSEVEHLPDYKTIRNWRKAHFSSTDERQTGNAEDSLPYKRFIWQDFEIRVGKNAADNDELTLKYSHKDDLWLHARGFAGSHVVIKHKAGKPIPKEVIAQAAGLAVWYSKGKSQPLCPVIVTPKKFVRKVKGSAPGAVKVEREEVIMANAIKPETLLSGV